ncbi:helix-turn-helix transcriptional regulator [Natrialbaceae archaeon A-gly3]
MTYQSPRIAVDQIVTPTHDALSEDYSPVIPLDTHAMTSPVVRFVGKVDESLLWVFAGQTTSVLDVVLVTVVSLLIGGLVGVRLAYVLSGRTVDISLPEALSGSRDEPLEEGDSNPQDDPVHSFQRTISVSTPSVLLSDEGEVIKLLLEHDGEIRQHQITAETGWSKSKVSRIVSRMADEDLIEKTASGRENVITLPTDTSRKPEPLSLEHSSL